MSINIKNIYCSQWLINEELKQYCSKKTNDAFYISPHDILYIKDTINYKTLLTDNYIMYNKYVILTNQTEHNENNFKQLVSNFDINKMNKIEIGYNSDIDKYIVKDGVHRLSILIYKNIFEEHIPLKYFNIIFNEKTITKIKQEMISTTGKVFHNGWYNNTVFGYHSFNIFNINIKGQRNPKKRLDIIKQYIEFKDKTVVDFGCNSGGMLLHLFEIKKGIGYDFNPDCIKCAKYLCNLFKFNNNLNFYEMDLNLFDFNILKKERIDIIFLLALGSWIKNWIELYTNAVKNVKNIIYETNNDQEAIPQLELFKKLGCELTLISEASFDDITNNTRRKTYLIKCPII